jgi:predicted PurR-regulated permease PerM
MKNWFTSDHQVSVSPSIVVFTTLFLGGLYFLYYVSPIVIMLFLAVIVMAALNPAVTKLERNYKVPRVLGILIMYLLWISVLVLAFSFIIPPLTVQLQNLIRFINNSFPLQEQFQPQNYSLADLNDLAGQLQGSVGTVLSIIISTFNGIFTLFTVTVMSFYLLIDRANLHKKISWFTKDREHLKMAEEFVNSVEYQLGGWVRGQLILMIAIGVGTYLGLKLLGIPYALPLALLAGLLEILPNLGPTIAAVPAIALAYVFGGPLMAGATLLFYLVIQQIENSILVPKIMKDNVDVNPLTTIVTILIGLQVAGVMGALLSVPAYIILRSAYSLWLKNK